LVGEQIRIAAEFDPQLPPIEAEPSQVFQVLMNLITNARDAMPEGGRISIRVYRETVRAGDPELIPAPQQGEFVALEVCDGGVGIDDQTLRHIFEPFFTNKIGGTGLGLAVVYGIVAQGGGHVRVRSSQTNGTAITAFFPISRGSARKEVDSTNVVHQGGTRRRVLLVEDQEPVRASLREMLRFLGYEVLTAGSGAEALETCRSSQPPPELVLSDIVMPGMLGTELVRSLRREHPGIVAVLMSGFADTAADDELEACRRSETPFLGKPFTLESLQTVMLQAERLQAERSSSSASESPPAASSG
jgi:CheY-like chemotaxis protein